MHRGTWRVHGVLSISRSIGDSHLKRWITAEPETRIIALTPDMEFLILASDGLWEQVRSRTSIRSSFIFCNGRCFSHAGCSSLIVCRLATRKRLMSSTADIPIIRKHVRMRTRMELLRSMDW